MLGLTKVIIGACAVAVLAGGAVTGWRVSDRAPATLPRPSCGFSVNQFVPGQTRGLASSRRALACFGAAIGSCRPASIGVTEMVTDGGTGYVFVIEPGTRPCQVAELSQDYTANFGGHEGRVVTVTCQVRSVVAESMTLRCAGRPIQIGARSALPS